MSRQRELANIKNWNEKNIVNDILGELRRYLKLNQLPEDKNVNGNITASGPFECVEEIKKIKEKVKKLSARRTVVEDTEAPSRSESRCGVDLFDSVARAPIAPAAPFNRHTIRHYMNNQQKPSFNAMLFDFIDASGEKDSAVYRRAYIDRRVFSKIRSDADYHPSKETAIALALALKLTRENAGELLEAAGYALSRSSVFDLIISFCIERGIFDICDVNDILEYFSLPQLGE